MRRDGILDSVTQVVHARRVADQDEAVSGWYLPAHLRANAAPGEVAMREEAIVTVWADLVELTGKNDPPGELTLTVAGPADGSGG